MKSEMGSEGLLFLIEVAKASNLNPYPLIKLLTLDDVDQTEAIVHDCLELGLLYNSPAVRFATLERDENTDPKFFSWGFK